MAGDPGTAGSTDFVSACATLQEIVSEADDAEKAVSGLLQHGQSVLGVENVHVTQIEPSANFWEAIDSTETSNGLVLPGETFPLETTYCRQIIEKDHPIALHNASEQGWADDVAYQTHGLETYLGVPLSLGEERFGTTCFVSEDPREQPFSREERILAKHLSLELSRIIEHETLATQMKRREQLSAVLSRILRHNLRNDLTVILGQADTMTRKVDPQLSGYVDSIVRKARDLRRLSEKSREIDHLVDSMDQRAEINLESLIDTIVSSVKSRHQVDRFDLEIHPETVRLSPACERALEELIDNAARHGGPDVSVAITARIKGDVVQIDIEDTGRGLPETETQIFEGVSETPLEHGSGLGLWLAYWVIDSQDGSMDLLDSSDGTHVRVQIPIVQSPLA